MRMRFRRDERESFVEGARVEVRNGRYWHPGEVIGPITRPYSIESVDCRVTGGKFRGETWSPGPTEIRLPQ